ncbi:MAG: transposase [Deltaproteobacteria bacterium]
MKQLRFGDYSTAEWKEFKHHLRQRFWQEVEQKQLADVRWLMQEHIHEEFELQIGAASYERSDGRQDERNGSRPRSYEIMGGYIAELRIPRARKMDIRFTIFDQWERVQPEVCGAMVTAYLLGKSSAAAVKIIEAFGQSRFSRSFVQRLVKGFEERFLEYLNRKITRPWPYVFIDGMVVKEYDVYLKEKVVIFAYGMNDEHEAELLGWVVADGEDEGAVRGLLLDLKQRGLHRPALCISDDSGGITAALAIEYPHVPRQLCSFHKIKNIQDHLIVRKHRKAILREAGDIYKLSCSKKEAVRRFRAFVRHWKAKEPEAVRLFMQGFEHTIRYFEFPKHMWISIRTNNPLEQFIGKVRDWTARFNYFHGRANLNLALFTFIIYKTGELVPGYLNKPIGPKPTLFVA